MRISLLVYLIWPPAMLLCYLPVKGQLRYGWKRTFAMILPALSALIVLFTWLTWKFDLETNGLLIPILLVSFAVYHFSLKVPFLKSLAVFFLVVSLSSIICNYAACLDAAFTSVDELKSYTLESYMAQSSMTTRFCAIQIGLTIAAVLLLAYPSVKYGEFLINQEISPLFWCGIIILSGAITVSNIVFLPMIAFLDYNGYRVNGSLVVLTAQLTVWVFMLIVLYTGIFGVLTISKVKERNRVLELKEGQFRSQQKYIKESEKTRHDFRHNLMTLAELYRAGDKDAFEQYLEQYIGSMPQKEVSTFCNNAALNALLNYYAHITTLNQIEFTLRVSLPDEIPVTDVDLCSMVGNILENAVAACQNAEEKMIQLTILSEDYVQLYIVAVNSFNGMVRQKDGKYLSTKHQKTGIGISSVISTAESYGGIAQFSHEGKYFYSDIAIPM